MECSLSKRLIRLGAIGSLAFAVGGFTGCSTFNSVGKGVSYLRYEIFRQNSQKNKESLKEVPHIEIDYKDYDEKNDLVIVNDRAYPKENSQPQSQLEEVINVESEPVFKIPLINATYIENPTTNSLVMNYKCRIPPSNLKTIIEPYLGGIKTYEFPARNMLIFSGKKEDFGDFSYVSSVLNQFDIPPEQMRVKLAILEFFGDNTYDREIKARISKSDRLILDMNLPSTFDGTPLKFGVGVNPIYNVNKSKYDFDSLIKFLDSTGKAEILSKIDLLAYNGKPVEMKNVSSVPYQETVIAESVALDTLRYRDTGVEAKITAFKNEDNFVTLKIEDAKSGEQTGFIGTVQRATFREANLKGEYILQNGETYVGLGSTFSRYKEVKRGIPLISKIPWIGDIFSSLSYENNRTHLIYLMEARIIPRDDLTGRIQK